MSEHNRVHFVDHDQSSDNERRYSSPQRHPEEVSRHVRRDSRSLEDREQRQQQLGRGRPELRQARSSVQFSDARHPTSPRISSPVVRDPTPYHPPRPFTDDEEDDEYDIPRAQFQSPLPDMMPSPSTPALGDPPHWHVQSPHPDDRVHPMNRGDLPPKQLPSQINVYHEDSSSEDTIYDEKRGSMKKSTDSFNEPSVPPLAYVRNADDTIRPMPTSPLRPALKQTPTGLEEGGVRAHRGLLDNLKSFYGLSRRQADYDDLTLSRANTAEAAAAAASNTVPVRHKHRRMDSTFSAVDQTEPKPLDPDHPLVTGVKRNTHGRRSRSSPISNRQASLKQRQIFILRLAKALMTFGAPSHRIESQLDATATVLEVDAQFIHLPSVIITSFGDQDNQTSDTHFVRANGRLALGKLHNVHQVYRQVVHDEIGPEEGTLTLIKLMKEQPLYGLLTRCLIAFACCALICPLAFGGSFLDMWVAGAGGAILCFLQLHAANKSAMYANVFEISVAILISFAARGLSTIPGQIFCYEAISSSGVVLILPGYLVLCSALELASKNMVNGSVRMVYAIIYSLFLGFGLTIGSDLYYIVDSRARHQRAAEATGNVTTVSVHGTFTAENATSIPDFTGTFTFSNGTRVDANTKLGCFRDPSWPWYQQNFPFWTWFLLVPAFSLFSSSWNLQPLRSKQLIAMIVISCAAFAANQVANYYIINRGDVVSAIGAFVVGILGNAYSRIFRGTAFQCMVIGVLFLVPSGIAAAGGLAQNYANQDDDQYTTGLAIGLRMVQVAIGITVGLFGSGLVVYSFGTRKQGALFAF